MGSMTARRRLTIIAAVLLVVGLSSALLVFINAGDEQDGALSYVIINGRAYPIMPGESKSYRHDVELYGGKWSLVADDFSRWFSSLWRGRRLTYTLGTVTLLSAAAVYLAALTSEHRKEDGEKER